MASFTIGDKTFESVTLTAFDGANITFSHAYGTKTLPVAAFTVEQIGALNKTTNRVFIDTSQLDLTPPSPEAVKEADALIQSAGEVNGLLSNGNTPLIEAVANGRANIIKVLIARSANVTLMNRLGTTPLQEAEARGDAKIIALLKSAGARHAPKVLPKTPYMLDCEKNIQECRAKAKQFNEQAKASRDKAGSFRRKAAQLSRALANPTEKQQAQDYLSRAQTEDLNAKSAADTAAYYEKQVKSWESAYTEAVRQQTAEAERFEKEEARSRERLSQQQKAQNQQPPPQLPAPAEKSAENKAPPSEDYRDPGLEQMKAQGQQMQADARTVQSMMEIMESKTAAEKELARQVEETKQKMAKVPSYVRYIVWSGLMFFVGGSLWFICMAFYDSALWGLLTLFFGPPAFLVYFIMHPKEMWFPFALYLFGLMMWGIPVMVYQVGVFDFLF